MFSDTKTFSYTASPLNSRNCNARFCIQRGRLFFKGYKMKSRHGLTLVELLIAITVVAILTAMLLPIVGGGLRAAKRFVVKNEMGQLETAIENFKNQFGFYPPSFDQIRALPAVGQRNQKDEFLSYINKMFPNHNEVQNGTFDIWWTEVGSNIDPGNEALVFWMTGLYKNAQFPLTGGKPIANVQAFSVVDNSDRYVFIDLFEWRLTMDADQKTARASFSKHPEVPFLYRSSAEYLVLRNANQTRNRYWDAASLYYDIELDSAGNPITIDNDQDGNQPNPTPEINVYHWLNPNTFLIMNAGESGRMGSTVGQVTNPPQATDLYDWNDNVINVGESKEFQNIESEHIH